MTTPRVLLVGAQHGNERLGPRLWQYITKYHPGLITSVDYICGNPKASRLNTRYVETDLNRSYAVDRRGNMSYEEKRALQILKVIDSQAYDYVLDLHTTTTDIDRMFVTVSLDGAPARIVNGTTIRKIALMPPDIGAHSLIGCVSQAISVEVNETVAKTEELLQEVVGLLNHLTSNKIEPKRTRDVYYIRELIPQDTELDSNCKNFLKTSYGFYPILLGEKNYITYQGFAAYDRRKVEL